MTSEEPLIIPSGGMANRMFQVMLAHEIRSRAGVGRIVGCHLPRWGMVSPLPDVPPEPYAVLVNHAFDRTQSLGRLGEAKVRTLALRGIAPTPSAILASPE